MKHRIIGTFGIVLAAASVLASAVAAQPTACNILYTISTQDSSAFGAAITIENTGTTAISSWSLTWAFVNGQTVSSLWNGVETQSGANVTVTNESYNGSIAAGGSVTAVGFNGTWNGTTNAVPTAFALSGTACSVNGVAPGGGGSGSFTLKPSAATLSVAQGASGADIFTVTDVSPFSGSVTLAASGLPSGVTATFGTNPATGSSVVTFAASSSASATMSTITITGTSGSLTASTTISLTVTSMGTGSFSLKASSASVAVTLGCGSSTDTITVTDVSPFTGSVTLATTGLPSGVTATYGTNPTTTASVLTFTASSSASPGTSTVTITGTSGSLTATTTISLTVTAQPQAFTISPSASALSVAQGASGTDSITVAESACFTGSTTLSASGLPTGVTAAFSTNPTTSTSVLTLTAASTATAATTDITVTGTSGTTSASTTIALTVIAVSTGSFSLKASSSNLSIAQGASGTDTITVTDVSPFAGSVTLAASGLPSGVTAVFGTNPATSTSVLTLSASSSAAAGTSTVTITGTSGSLSATTTIALTVTGTSSGGACSVIYTISPQSSSAFGAALTINNTSSTAWTSWTLTWTFANGQTVSSLWNGVEAQSGANVTLTNENYNGSVAAGGSVTGLGFNGTWNGTTNAVPTNFAVNGTACGGGGSGSFTLKPSAATLSVAQGASGTDTITVTDVSPFAGSVTLAASGLPSGVTATFGTNPATGSSVVTFAASSSAAAATSNITITGASGSLSATTTISLKVTAASTGSFTLKPSAATLSVAQGASGTDTITVTDVSPFTGSVTLAVSGLPSGVTAAFGTNPATSTSVLTLTASSSAAAATTTITITGASGSLSATTAITLTVVAGISGSFTLAPTSSTLALYQGSSGVDVIEITDVSPFASGVTFTASGLPSGVTASFSSNPSTTGSVLTLTAGSTAATGSSTVTVTGASGSLTETTSIDLTISPTTVVTLNPALPPGGNFNLTIWNLQLPIGSAGNVDEIASAQMVGDSGFTDAYFYTNTTDGGMMFFVPEDGVTTSGSSYPRSELREVTTAGANANWAIAGTNWMSATLQVVNALNHTCIGQVHIGSAIESGLASSTKPLLELFYYGTGGTYNSGEVVLAIEATPAGGNETFYDIANVPMGTEFNYMITLSGTTEILLTLNGVTTTYPLPSGFVGYGMYFKAGDYLQTSGTSSTTGALDEFYALSVSHSE